VARFDPKTGTFGRFEIDPGTHPHTIAFDSKGNHSIDPVSMRPREYVLPSDPARGGQSLPCAMTVDDQHRLWFVETELRPNRLVGFDPRGERFFGITPVGSADAPNTVRHMGFDKATQSIRFGSDQGTIGRAVVPKGNPKPVS
jgi:virginiamycin B lyase